MCTQGAHTQTTHGNRNVYIIIYLHIYEIGVYALHFSTFAVFVYLNIIEGCECRYSGSSNGFHHSHRVVKYWVHMYNSFQLCHLLFR